MGERRVRFSMEDDLNLIREVITENPFEDPGTWQRIRSTMNKSSGKNFSLRAIRDHVKHLLKSYRKNETLERKK